MNHIAIWSFRLNSLELEHKFSPRLKEYEFWQHLNECLECREKAIKQYENHSELRDKSFWAAVERYLEGFHPEIEGFRDRIYDQARIDLREIPTVNTVIDFVEKYEQLDHHLVICSKCYRLYKEIYERLRQHDSVVGAAHFTKEVRAMKAESS